MNLANEFPLDKKVIYLNHAAVAPWPRRSVEAVEEFARENMHQGSLAYPRWLEKEATLKSQLQQLINAPSAQDIALVKNTSEALSFIAYGIEWNSGDNIVSTDQEFPSNRIVWESLQDKGVTLRQADLYSADTPEDSLLALVDTQTRMLSVSSVQYGTGLRLDIERLGRFCHDNDILFCVDAIQSVGAERIDVEACHVDFLAADGHKWMLGPEGLGLFYCRAERRKDLQLNEYGWHMVEAVGDFDAQQWQPARDARRFECGSPNMLTAHALSASLSLLLELGMEHVETAISERISLLYSALSTVESIQLITPLDEQRRSGILTFRYTDRDSDEQFRRLLDAGVFCAQRGGGIRLSPHFYTPMEQLEKVVGIVKQ